MSCKTCGSTTHSNHSASMKAGAEFDSRHESNKEMKKVHESHAAKSSALNKKTGGKDSVMPNADSVVRFSLKKSK